VNSPEPAGQLIDIVAAIDSVIDAAVTMHTRDADRPHSSLAESALALAVPAARQPHAAASMLEQLRAEPAAAAARNGCTLGAVLVWRAVDRAERAGETSTAAAEAALRATVAYLDLLPKPPCTALGADDLRRCTALAVLEFQARLALSSPTAVQH
jgi:hypothetical protein